MGCVVGLVVGGGATHHERPWPLRHVRQLPEDLSSGGSVSLYKDLLLDHVARWMNAAPAAVAVEAFVACAEAAIAANKASSFVNRRFALANFAIDVDESTTIFLAVLRCRFAEGDMCCGGSFSPKLQSPFNNAKYTRGRTHTHKP